MGKLKNFWTSIGAFFSKAFSFMVNVLAMPAEPTWTKDSSYALIVCNDYKNTSYPVRAVEHMTRIFSDCASTVDVIVGDDATCEEVLRHLEKGAGYKTFFFYIFCHGGKRSLFLCRRTLTSKNIWNALRQSNGRIVGFFDACKSGSLLEDPEGTIRQVEYDDEEDYDGEDDGKSIADSIVELFRQHELTAREDGDLENLPKTQLRLYSAAGPDTVSLYLPNQSSMYSDAIAKTYDETEGKTYSEFDEKLVKNGTLHVTNNPDYEWIIPQVASYGADFSSYPRFR